MDDSQFQISATAKTTTLINCFHDAVVLFKKDTIGNSIKICGANNPALKLFGYSRDEFENLSIRDVLQKTTYDKILGAKDHSGILVGYCVAKKNRIFPVEFYSNCIDHEDETHMLVIKDITLKRESEEQIARYIEELHETKDLMESNAYELVSLNSKLAESEERLKELNASKDKFFSIIAHDLKSTFASFSGLTNLLTEDFDEMEQDEIKDYISELNKSANNVYNLLENLLSWSRIQTGRMEFCPEFVSSADIVSKTVSFFEDSARQKKILLIPQIFCANQIFADRNMIETVLRNLVSNAIKFTRPNGEVILYLSGNDDLVEFSVKDSGIGINKKDLSKLFRVDSAYTTSGTNQEIGTGLGLILCKELIERNKGTIRVESEVGVGTKFSFTIPSKILLNKE